MMLYSVCVYYALYPLIILRFYTLAISLYTRCIFIHIIYYLYSLLILFIHLHKLYRMLQPKPVHTPSHITLTKFNQ